MAQWELIRDALSENAPIIIPEGKISENVTFEISTPVDQTIAVRTIATIKQNLGNYLKGTELTFSKKMTETESTSGIILWASTAKSSSKKRPASIKKYEINLAIVLTVFTRADQTIQEIHEANGY